MPNQNNRSIARLRRQSVWAMATALLGVSSWACFVKAQNAEVPCVFLSTTIRPALELTPEDFQKLPLPFQLGHDKRPQPMNAEMVKSLIDAEMRHTDQLSRNATKGRSFSCRGSVNIDSGHLIAVTISVPRYIECADRLTEHPDPNNCFYRLMLSRTDCKNNACQTSEPHFRDVYTLINGEQQEFRIRARSAAIDSLNYMLGY